VLARFGRIDLRSEAAFAIALRTDTPKQAQRFEVTAARLRQGKPGKVGSRKWSSGSR
jgi:hypothetical protein